MKIGITIGDINGIGIETILKTFSDERIFNQCTPIIYGSSKIIAYHKNILEKDSKISFESVSEADQAKEGRLSVINCWQENVNITLGKATETAGEYAFKSLEAAVSDLKAGKIEALVTAPINKKSMQMGNFPYPGHTEYLDKSLNGKALMVLANENLRVGLITGHIPVSAVAGAISKKLIQEKIRIFDQALREDFGIEKPTIAILGLNPHAGDEGVIGEEENTIIRPAIIEIKKRENIMVLGPYAADGFFGSGQYAKFDGILAMYHDQGLVPFKALSFGHGVNFTAGLDRIRTSPDHGTAYEIAGKNEANPASFREALFLAIDLANNRKSYKEMHSYKVQKNKLQDDDLSAASDDFND